MSKLIDLCGKFNEELDRYDIQSARKTVDELYGVIFATYRKNFKKFSAEEKSLINGYLDKLIETSESLSQDNDQNPREDK